MSTGHFHLSYRKPEELKKMLSVAWGSAKFRAHMDQKFRVDRTFDIPYVAGYSKDAKTIFVDRHLPISLMFGGVKHAILPFVIEHERTEKACIDVFGWDYEQSHKLATYVEHMALKQRGISPGQYERALDPYIKAEEREKIQRVPANLDLKPYMDSRDEKLIAHMKAKMK